MPLTNAQAEVLQVLSRHRTPDSHIAGGLAINRNGPRFSEDIDIFNDSAERLRLAAEDDAAALQQDGFQVQWIKEHSDTHRRALVTGPAGSTFLDWASDSDFRFFPAVSDQLFGYVLHPVDLACNKAAAASDRRVPRDIIDLLTIHEKILPLGSVLNATVVRFPGMTPEEMLAEINRNSRFTVTDFEAVALVDPNEIRHVFQRIRAMIEDARIFLKSVPSECVGYVFLKDHQLVQPDMSQLEHYRRISPARRGIWPGSEEIGAAMLEHFFSDETKKS